MTPIRNLFLAIACASSCLAVVVGPVYSADEKFLRNPTQPQLIYNAAGHTATVWSLIYTPDGESLISAGNDGVIHVWNPRGENPALIRTIRPPIWKEPRGRIHAMALTPNPKKDQERLLAFAGISVIASNTSFIQLYQFPGVNGLQTGDPVAMLPDLKVKSDGTEEPTAPGVARGINSLCFDGSGTLLASGGIDRRIVVWNADTRTIAHVLADADWSGKSGYVGKVILSKDGKRLWSGGDDGYVRLWNLGTATPVAYGPPFGMRPPAQKVPLHPAYAITAMSLLPDESALIVGREDGSLTRYDAANLARPRPLIPAAEMLGPVETVAVHPAGKLVGLARINRKFKSDAEEPYTECLIEIRSADDGRIVRTAPNVLDRVMASAFRPDGKQFAYAGGESQAVHLLAMEDEKNEPPTVLRGEGGAIGEVGMSGDLSVVGFRRLGSDVQEPYEAFDVKTRRVIADPPKDLVRTSRLNGTFQNYQVVPIDRNHLKLDWKTGSQVVTWDLDEVGRWFSYCWIPAPDGQKLRQPLLAVGGESRILVFAPWIDAKGGFAYRVTRHLRGHSGPVLAMSPSAESRFLITGGTDQLVRIWSLKGAGELAELGASMVPNPDGTITVGEVDPDGFAREAGLRAGDLVTLAGITGNFHGPGRPKAFAEHLKAHPPRPMAEYLKAYPLVPPGDQLVFAVKRNETVLLTSTRKQQEPVLSLFLTRDRPRNVVQGLVVPAEREWVLWNPDGFYDTSVTADRRFLGWHRNTPTPLRTNVDMLKSTNFFPMRTFEDLLRRPDVIRGLLDGQPRSAALPVDPATNETIDVAAIIDVESPPVLRVKAPVAKGDAAVQVTEASVPFALELQPGAGPEPIPLRDLRILVDGKEVLQPALPAKLGTVPIKGEIPSLSPGLHTIVFTATNEKPREQSAKLLIDYRPKRDQRPPAPVKEPELLVVSIGVGQFEDPKAFPPIAKAATDVKAVVEDLFISKDVQSYYDLYPDNVPVHARPLILNEEKQKRVTAQSVQGVVEGLKARLQGQQPKIEPWIGKPATPPPGLGEGDTLVLVVSSHVLGLGKSNPRLVTFETKPKDWEKQGIDTEAITSLLGELVRKGCRVVTILDGYHADDDRESVGVREWAYRLDQKGVVVCLPPYNNPSPVDAQRGPSPFFRALLALAERGKWGGQVRQGDRLTLDTFRKVLAAAFDDEVGGGAQSPYVNTPATLDGTSPLFDPPPASSAMAQVGAVEPDVKK